MSRPIRKNIEKYEAKINTLQQRLGQIENALADSGIYDSQRKDELLKVMNEQTQVNTELKQNEEQMFELMFELEELESSFQD